MNFYSEFGIADEMCQVRYHHNHLRLSRYLVSDYQAPLQRKG